ncbi:MAG: hypothetical protein JWP87_3091, partial [Labilithrix sp.]|nr:hypothetical protein [Labilithrix sp.]
MMLAAFTTLAGCGGAEPSPVCPSTPPAPVAAAPAAPAPASAPAPAPTPAAAPAPKLSPPIDDKAVAAATGVDKTDSSDGVVKASFPRTDVPIAIDGWKMPPFMGVTSWAAFSPAREGVAEAMVMGDLVLFEDEVNPVMSVLLDNGVQVTALHNHFFFDAPHVYFMHIGAEGSVAALGKGVKLAMDKVAEIRKKTPKPAATFAGAALPAKSNLDAAKLDAALGSKGQSKDGMYKAVMGRKTQAACGCSIGKAMGVNTWAAFAGSEDNAVVDGDFAVAESELSPVLAKLRAGGINIVAIHSH